MRPYPRYKPTGLAWLPSVPEHWDVRQLKRMARLKGGVGFPVEKQGRFNESFRFIKVNALASQIDLSREYDTISRDDVAQLHAQVFPAGSIVFAKVGAALLLRRFEELPFDCCIDNNMMAIFDIKENPKWLRYALSRLDFNRIVNPGAVPSVNQSQVETMPLPLPPSSEQDRIVRYLDEKTAAIDELVRAKERQIELLRERKQALVSAAVIGRDISTKCPFGRDASTMRPGCGRAMGASLPVYRLKELVRFFKGLNITKADLIPEGANVISYGQIHSKENDGRSLKDSFLRHTSFELTNEAARLSFGDIVFADTSEDQAGIGNCVLNDRHDPVWAGYHTVTARPRNPEIAPYLTVLFQSNWWRDQLRRSSDGVKVYSVTQRSLGNTRVVLPPLPEQRRIVAHLDSVCSELDAAEAAIRKQISLLQELRTRLVSDAVTGAVEV